MVFPILGTYLTNDLNDSDCHLLNIGLCTTTVLDTLWTFFFYPPNFEVVVAVDCFTDDDIEGQR